MTTQHDKLHARVEGFMNANYPCDCAPNDPDCSKNYFETEFILNTVAEEAKIFIQSLPADISRDELLAKVEQELFLQKEVL
jgi:hypothetical protein